jgi:hypothetical protein
MRHLLRLLAGIGLLFATELPAQQLTLDKTTGNYRLVYHSSESKRNITVEIEPPNKVDPDLSVDFVERMSDGSYRYVYRIANRRSARSRQAIKAFEIPCPSRSLAAARAADGWIVWHSDRSLRLDRKPLCHFASEGPGIGSGTDRTQFEIRTRSLPRIAVGNFWGITREAKMSSREHDELDEKVHILAQSVTGVTGGWATASVVSPTRIASSSRSQQVESLRLDVQAVCGDLRWVKDISFCRYLLEKVAASQAALSERNEARFRTEMRALLSGLETRRPKGSENTVSPNAYWLLKTIVEHLVST